MTCFVNEMCCYLENNHNCYNRLINLMILIYLIDITSKFAKLHAANRDRSQLCSESLNMAFNHRNIGRYFNYDQISAKLIETRGAHIKSAESRIGQPRSRGVKA